MNTTKFFIRSHLLEAMSMLAAEPERAPLANVFLDTVSPNQYRLFATNGRLAGFLLLRPEEYALVPSTMPKTTILPIPDFKRLRAGTAMLEIEQSPLGPEAWTSYTSGEFTHKLSRLGGTIPDLDSVIPDENRDLADSGISLDINLLALFTAALKKAGEKNPGYFTLKGGGYNKETNLFGPLHAFTGKDRFYGVIMPLREEIALTVPPWAKKPRESAPVMPEAVQATPETLNTPTEAPTTQQPTL